MTFVHHHQEVVRKIIQQCKRRLTMLTPVNMHRIVFNAIAIPNFSHHLEVVLCALSQPLRFKQFPFIFKLFQSRLQLCFDLQHCSLHALIAGHIVRRRKNHRLLEVLQRLTCYGINNGDAFDRVTEHLKTCHRFVISRMHFDGVTANAEVASTKS